MPGGNGTGPAGLGAMTGKGAGFCAGYAVPGCANPVGGRGYFGRSRGFWGRGGGRGWRNWFYATGIPGWARANFRFSGPVTPTVATEQEVEGLKQQAEFLQNSLNQINERIEQLGKAKAESP